MVFLVSEFKNVIDFQFVWWPDVMTSCHDVTKPDLPISACRCDRKLILFLFPWFFKSLSSKIWMIFNFIGVLASWRHVMTSQKLLHLSQVIDSLENDPVHDSMVFLVAYFGNLRDHVFVRWYHVVTSCHDVISILSVTLEHLLMF